MFDLVKGVSTGKLLLWTVVVFLFSTSVSGQASETWQKITAKNEGFTVLMPKGATTSESVKSATGVKLLNYSASERGVTYVVVTGVVAGVDWEKAEIRDRFITGFESGACASEHASKTKCEVKRTRDLRYRNFPAIDIRFILNDQIVGTGRIVFVDDRAYALLTSGLGIENLTAQTNKFLESFEVVR